MASRFSRDPQTGRILIYINTWNHMFSEKNNNPHREDLITLRDYPLYQGTRQEVEAFYQDKK